MCDARVFAGIIGGLNDPIIKGKFFSDDSDSQQSLMEGVLTACILVGAFAGCFMCVEVANRWGRRLAFRIIGVVALVSSILLAFMPTFPLIVLVRTILGISVGFCAAACPWYVTDSVSAATRGSVGTVFQINVCAFILLAEIINYVRIRTHINTQHTLEPCCCPRLLRAGLIATHVCLC
jgi:SP family galactose:H+ symporter-like MFS transporter